MHNPARHTGQQIDSPSTILIAVLITGFALGACENTVDPFAETGTNGFAISGYLDMGQDTQFVRVARISPDFDPASDGRTLAVATTHLESGRTTDWRDSLFVADDGDLELIFYAPFRPAAAGSYALEVVSGDAEILRGFTRLPASPAVTIEPPRAVGAEVSQRLTWDGIAQPSSVRMSYRVRVGSGGMTDRIDLVYDRRHYSDTGDRVQVIVPFDRDALIVRQTVAERHGETSVRLDSLKLTVRVLSREWGQDTSAANIENGEGFFASVAQFSAGWTLPDSLARRVGYDIAH